MATFTWMLSFEIQRCRKQIPPVPMGGADEEGGTVEVPVSSPY